MLFRSAQLSYVTGVAVDAAGDLYLADGGNQRVRKVSPSGTITTVAGGGTYGNVGRDTLTGPGAATVDFSVLKNTPLTERLKLQFRAELFNILNRANFGTPNTVVFTSATSGASPTAGVITATSTTSRQIQFGLKLIW